MKPSYSCSVSKNGPASLTGAVSDIAGSCSFNVQSLAGSLRFSGTTQYLSKTLSTPTNAKRRTLSTWVKRSVLGGTSTILSAEQSTAYYASALRFVNDQITVYDVSASSIAYQTTTSAYFKDPSAWYHVVVSVDTTVPSLKIYVNGDQQAVTGSQPALNSV